MVNENICASSNQEIEIVMGADKAHVFFAQLEAKLLEAAGRQDAKNLAVTIYVKAYAASDEGISGGLEVTLDEIGKGEKQIARLDF